MSFSTSSQDESIYIDDDQIENFDDIETLDQRSLQIHEINGSLFLFI
jgi:hypothetical protein